MKVLPVGDASLILKVDNQNTIPIELQINSNIYEVKDEMGISRFIVFRFQLLRITKFGWLMRR